MRLAPFSSAAVATRTLEAPGGVQRPCATAPADAADKSSDPRTTPDLREHSRRASFSRGESGSLEKHDREVCGTVHLYRLEDGRLLARRVHCRMKACPKCGRRLREEYAAGYAAVVADVLVARFVVPDAEWRTFQRRLRNRKLGGVDLGALDYLRIPGPVGASVVYVECLYPEEALADAATALAADFAAMPSDRRHVSASKAWRDAYHAWREDQHPTTKTPPEHLGQLRRPLEQVAMIAAELDLLLEQREEYLLLRDPPDQATWERFCALAGLYRRRGEAMAA
jgi:hypothetical protein